MSLEGKWVGHETKDFNGKSFIIATIEYKGSDWKSLSTFDEGLIKVANSLQTGDAIMFETQKSGKYTNLTALYPSGETPVKVSPGRSGGSSGTIKQAPPSYGKPKDDRAISLLALMKSCIEAKMVKTAKELDALGYICAPVAQKVVDGEYFEHTAPPEDGEDVEF